MHYLKMIGLAVVAVAAVMAIAGTGTASATVFCHTTTSPCPEKWKSGTEPRFVVKPGTAGIWKDTSGAIAAKCPEGELRGTITNAGSATETVKASVPASGLTCGKTSKGASKRKPWKAAPSKFMRSAAPITAQ